MDFLFSPIKLLAEWLTLSVFGLAASSHLAEAISFFIFDTIKILILLAVIVFAVSIIRTFFPPQKIRALLSHKFSIFNNFLAALLGIVTPFCTCSAIPLFVGFVQAGVPLGVTFSFLIASPMINEIAIVLLLGLFGWQVAGLYILSGLLISVLAGFLLGKMNLENQLEAEFFANSKLTFSAKMNSWLSRVKYAQHYTIDIVKKVWLYLIIGIAIGAFIHGYVPTDFLVSYAGADKWYAVPLAVLAGIPLYSNAAGVAPLISVLVQKGVAMGTALAFMMAVVGLSLPEFLILKKVMKIKLIIIFASIVGLGILLTGYLFNFVLK